MYETESSTGSTSERCTLIGRAASVMVETSRRTWKSCCFEIDPVFCRFFVCVLVSVGLLLHSLLELSKDGSCDQKSFYGPIVTMIIGIWTPTPKSSSKK